MSDKKKYILKSECFLVEVMKVLDTQRRQKDSSFCDITLEVAGEQLLAHKAVLAACSGFFKDKFNNKIPPLVVQRSLDEKMFQPTIPKKRRRKTISESSCGIALSVKMSPMPQLSVGTLSPKRSKLTGTPRIGATLSLPGINPKIFAQLLDYMYTTELWITEENVIDMLLISCLLQVRTVKEACMFILIKQPSWKRGAVKRLSNNLNGGNRGSTKPEKQKGVLVAEKRKELESITTNKITVDRVNTQRSSFSSKNTPDLNPSPTLPLRRGLPPVEQLAKLPVAKSDKVDNNKKAPFLPSPRMFIPPHCGKQLQKARRSEGLSPVAVKRIRTISEGPRTPEIDDYPKMQQTRGFPNTNRGIARPDAKITMTNEKRTRISESKLRRQRPVRSDSDPSLALSYEAQANQEQIRQQTSDNTFPVGLDLRTTQVSKPTIIEPTPAPTIPVAPTSMNAKFDYSKFLLEQQYAAVLADQFCQSRHVLTPHLGSIYPPGLLVGIPPNRPTEILIPSKTYPTWIGSPNQPITQVVPYSHSTAGISYEEHELSRNMLSQHMTVVKPLYCQDILAKEMCYASPVGQLSSPSVLGSDKPLYDVSCIKHVRKRKLMSAAVADSSCGESVEVMSIDSDVMQVQHPICPENQLDSINVVDVPNNQAKSSCATTISPLVIKAQEEIGRQEQCVM